MGTWISFRWLRNKERIKLFPLAINFYTLPYFWRIGLPLQASSTALLGFAMLRYAIGSKLSRHFFLSN